jgi:Tfp pilus assembly protein PilP
MTATNPPEPTSPKVAKLATETARLDSLAVIGIFGSAAAPAALIRGADGTTQRVSVGDTVARQTVAAIGEDRVILSKGNKTTTLTLPKS